MPTIAPPPSQLPELYASHRDCQSETLTGQIISERKKVEHAIAHLHEACMVPGDVRSQLDKDTGSVVQLSLRLWCS